MEEFSFNNSSGPTYERCVLLCTLIPFSMAFIFFVYVLNCSIVESIICCIGGFSIFMITMGIQSIKYRKMKFHRKLLLDDEKITIKDKKKSRSILWNSITKVNILRNYKGIVVSVRIRGNNGKSLTLFDFDDMNKISSIITEKIPNSTQVRIKQHKLDWYNPFVAMPIWLGVSIALFFVFILLGKYFWDPFSEIANRYLIHPLVKFIFRIFGFEV